MLRKLLLLLLIFACVFLLFKPAFGSFFFQDDWFSLRISQARNAADFLNFFMPRTDVVYYRPLGMQIPFFLNSVFFGINPLPFRIVTLLIHLLNGYLVYRILEIIIKKNHLAISGALFYLFSASHMIIFYWSATFAFVLGPFFYFLGLLLYIRNNKLGSLGMFILGLLTNELVVTLPIILTVWMFLNKKKEKYQVKSLVVFAIASVSYIFFRLTLATPVKAASYSYLNNLKQFLFNIRNYLFWSFNWPDDISNQFVSFLKFNPLFWENFKKYIALFSAETFIIVLVFAVIPVFYLVSRKSMFKETCQIGLTGLIWFGVAISPVIYYSQHAFPYYLPIPLVGLLITGLILYQNWEKYIEKKRSYAILICCLIIWYWSSWTNIRLNTNIHWAPRRSSKSKTLTQNIQKFFPVISPNTVVFMPEADENKWALGDQNALKFLYNENVGTFYGNHQQFLNEYKENQTVKFIDYHE